MTDRPAPPWLPVALSKIEGYIVEEGNVFTAYNANGTPFEFIKEPYSGAPMITLENVQGWVAESSLVVSDELQGRRVFRPGPRARRPDHV